MNKYPSWWNQGITIYNQYKDPTTHKIKWYRTVIPKKCFWRYTQTEFIVSGTLVKTNETICRIPKQSNFLEPYQWEQLTDEEKSKFFTLRIGDMIVKGVVEDDIDEYTAGSRSNDFLNKYKKLQGCTIIAMVAVNTDGGRGTEHYLVKGS